MVLFSDEALEVLPVANALRLEGADLVFPGVARKPMSDVALISVIRDMNELFHFFRPGGEQRRCRCRGGG